MKHYVLHVLACLLVVALAPAQREFDLKKMEKSFPPFKLATKTDKGGLKQWDKFPVHNCPACKASKKLECLHCKHLEKPTKCPECKVTRKAPCHHCVGKGQLADPLQFAPCPSCNGHKIFICFMCGNKGRIFSSVSTDKGSKCMSCKEAAGLACTVCRGKGLVKSPLGGKVAKANLKKLVKAKKTVTGLLKSVHRFRATGVARKDRKKFDALFKKAKSDLSPLKDLPGMVKIILKGVHQPQYKDNDKTIIQALDRVKQNVLLYLLHQDKVLDQCIERAKFNESAGKK